MTEAQKAHTLAVLRELREWARVGSANARFVEVKRDFERGSTWSFYVGLRTANDCFISEIDAAIARLEGEL